MEIRQAFPNEVDQIMLVIEDARKQLAASGSNQWQGKYPDEDTIYDDVLTGQGYVALLDGKIVAYAAVITDGDPAMTRFTMVSGNTIITLTSHFTVLLFCLA